MSASPSHLLAAVPEQIAEIIFALCQTVSMRLRMRTVSQAQVTYIVGRLLGIRGRFRRLVARIRAGHVPRERAPAPSAAAAAQAEPVEFPLGFRPPPPGWRRWAVRADKPVPLWRSLPQNTFAWLLPLAPNVPEFRDSAAWHRALLLDLLVAPEMRALLMASRRVGDSLRPLCWMLGIEASVLYPARPTAGAADVSGVDAAPSAPAADNRGPDPAADETAFSAVATPMPIISAGTEPIAARPRAQDSDEFFAMA